MRAHRDARRSIPAAPPIWFARPARFYELSNCGAKTVCAPNLWHSPHSRTVRPAPARIIAAAHTSRTDRVRRGSPSCKPLGGNRIGALVLGRLRYFGAGVGAWCGPDRGGTGFAQPAAPALRHPTAAGIHGRLRFAARFVLRFVYRSRILGSATTGSICVGGVMMGGFPPVRLAAVRHAPSSFDSSAGLREWAPTTVVRIPDSSGLTCRL